MKRWILLSLLIAPLVHAQDMSTAMHDACASNGAPSSTVSREVLAGDVAHYKAKLRVGSGAYDFIELHRFVRESSPWHPRPTSKSVFLIHGDTISVEASWVRGTDGSRSTGVGVYLAAHDVDAWAIEPRWGVFPTDGNTSAMCAWNLETDVSDARLGIVIARAVRVLTGSGASRVKVLGWSRGGQIAYVLAGLDATLPPWARSVGGLIPFDTAIKSSDPGKAQTLCDLSDQLKSQIAAGQCAISDALVLAAGNLAEADPNSITPLPLPPPLSSFTNRQVALLFGGATYNFTGFNCATVGGVIDPGSCSYHLVGATFDSVGVPTGLRYSAEVPFFRAMQNAAPFEAAGTQQQGDEVICHDTPLDDHLADIAVPVLNVWVAGGLGQELSGYSSTLLTSSPDVQQLFIQKLSPAERAFDFGHDDVVRATSSRPDVWDPIIAWL